MGDVYLIIRQIIPNDLEAMEDLDKKCFTNEVRYNRYTLDYYLSLPESIGLVQTMEDKLLGFIITTMAAEQIANIVTIDVHPLFRRHSIGSNLINAAKVILNERRVSKISLQVADNNQAAIKFYIKHGFKVMKKLPKYYPNTDGYQMEYITR